MKVSIKNLNKILEPHGLELIKGYGYFYFSELDGCDVARIPDSIYVYALNQGDWFFWENLMSEAIIQSKEEY